MIDYKNGFERRVPKKYRHMFVDFSDEHGVGDGYWGYLSSEENEEYINNGTGCHIVHEWNLRDFDKAVRDCYKIDK